MKTNWYDEREQVQKEKDHSGVLREETKEKEGKVAQKEGINKVNHVPGSHIAEGLVTQSEHRGGLRDTTSFLGQRGITF